MNPKEIIENAPNNACAMRTAAMDAQPGQTGEGAGRQDGSTSINQDEVTEAYKDCQNDRYWSKAYEGAPEGAKHRIVFMFWVTRYKDAPSFNRAMYLSLRNSLDSSLTIEDLEYLVNVTKKESLKAHYRELLLAKGESQGSEQGAMAEGGGDVHS